MKREDVIKKVNELPWDRRDFWVVTGAAMVLYGIREETRDIDLGCTSALADRLEAEGDPCDRKPDGSRAFRIGGDVEVFENWLNDTVEQIEGIPVVSLPGLVEMKRRLGREKDLRDIRLIREYLAQGKSDA